MTRTILLISALLATAVLAEEAATPPVRGHGFVTLGWVFAKTETDAYELWAQHSDNVKLKGSVSKFLDWPNVSRLVVLYNAWHLQALQPDARVEHLEANLKTAAFGDRFKGPNPGGTYVFLLRYQNSDREVLLSFDDGVFLIESEEGIGAVDIRKAK